MAAPGTAPERFVMVGADSDAARFDRALSVPKKIWPSGTRAFVPDFVGCRGQVTPGTPERPYPIQTGTLVRLYAVQGFRGLRVQGSRGSGSQEVSGVQGFTGVFTVQKGGGDWKFECGTADLALIQKFIVHRIHTPTVDVDEPS